VRPHQTIPEHTFRTGAVPSDADAAAPRSASRRTNPSVLRTTERILTSQEAIFGTTERCSTPPTLTRGAEPAQRAEIHAKHDDLRERIDEHVAAFCDYARQEMIDSLGRTRSMEGEGAPKRQFVLESSRRAFLRKQLENLPKPLRTAVEQARKDAPSGDAGTGGEAPSGLAHHLARLEAQLDSLSQRVESALGDVRAATTAESQ
jgi:hypothetical protein